MKRSAVRYAAWMLLLCACAFAIFVIYLSPMVTQIFANVSNDHCRTFEGGEPDRNDPDCHNGMWDGRNYVEEWERAHPNPSQKGWWGW